MAKAAKKTTQEQIEVSEIHMREIRLNVLGTSAMIMNRFAQKAWQELLFPSKQKNRAALEQNLKHDPLAEFQGALYRNRDKSKALFHVPNMSFHGALSAAALDLPGAKKAQIERLTRITDVNIELFGVPQLFMAMVRNSDINRTPDVRTRPIFPEWACTLHVRYVMDILSEKTVVNLMGAAGVIVGIGDWRGAKGGPYGAFKLVGDNDADFKRVVRTQGWEAQVKAYAKPQYFDANTEELMTWFEAEVLSREMSDKLGGGENGSRKKAPRGKVIVEHGDGQYEGEEDRAAQ